MCGSPLLLSNSGSVSSFPSVEVVVLAMMTVRRIKPVSTSQNIDRSRPVTCDRGVRDAPSDPQLRRASVLVGRSDFMIFADPQSSTLRSLSGGLGAVKAGSTALVPPAARLVCQAGRYAAGTRIGGAQKLRTLLVFDTQKQNVSLWDPGEHLS